jgi:hypothetical protein
MNHDDNMNLSQRKNFKRIIFPTIMILGIMVMVSLSIKNLALLTGKPQESFAPTVFAATPQALITAAPDNPSEVAFAVTPTISVPSSIEPVEVATAFQDYKNYISEAELPKPIEIEAGEFLYGFNNTLVYVDRFALDQTEVTIGMYQKCVEAKVCPPIEGPGAELIQFDRPNLPVTMVSGEMADTFCKWVGRRLPTEAEWEKALRGEAFRRFPWGEEKPTCERANINESNGEPCLGEITEVGSYPKGASPEGVMDLVGNVWEFMDGFNKPAAYLQPQYDNPRNPDTGTRRIIKGGDFGTWFADAVGGEVRYAEPKEIKAQNIGFRCARSLQEETLPLVDEVTTDLSDPGVPIKPSRKKPVQADFLAFNDQDFDVFTKEMHTRQVTVAIMKEFGSKDQVQREKIANAIFDTWNKYWLIFGGFPFEDYTIVIGENLPFGEMSGHGGEYGEGWVTGFDKTFDNYSYYSHGIFHAWNSTAFNQANDANWFTEGITTYYDKRVPKSGEYYLGMSRYYDIYMNEVKNGNDVALCTITGYSRNTTLQYEKGGLVAYLLDQELMKRGHNLDEVLREVYQKYGVGSEIGRPSDQDIMQIINTVSGADFSKFYQDYICGTEPLPFSKEDIIFLEH